MGGWSDNPLLWRQVKKHLKISAPDEVPGEMLPFLEAVAQAYQEFEEDKQRAERSLELSTQELMQATAEMTAVFQAIPDLFVHIDGANVIRHVRFSPAKGQYRFAGPVQDKSLAEAFADEKVSQSLEAAADAARTSREMQVVEFQCHLDKGRREYYEVRVLPVMEQDVIFMIRNISERKRAEDELKRYAALLERNNRDLQDFAYVASHDLQEPLRKILTFGERLKAKGWDALPEMARDYLDRMLNAAERMQGLITGLLEFSRVTTKAKPFQDVDLEEIIRHVLADLEVRIEETQGTVEVASLPRVKADPLQMRQLFQNLIGNALKYRKMDTPPVVKVYPSDEELPPRKIGSVYVDMVRFVVEDNGIGFPQEQAEKVFTIFSRLHGRNSPYEGTGVGLSICRKIVERHNGTIEAQSEEGVGSKFIVTLPVDPDPPAAEDDETDLAMSESAASAGL